MASSLLDATAGTYASAYADNQLLLDQTVLNGFVQGRGNSSGSGQATVLSQSVVQEQVGFAPNPVVATDRLVAFLKTGVLETSSLQIVGGAFGAANPSIGAAALVGGTKTVQTHASDPAAFIFVCGRGGGVPANYGSLSVTSQAGDSFVVESTNAADTQSFAWFIVNDDRGS